MLELDAQEIQKIIPHRFPFLMIDEVKELIPDERMEAVKNITANDYYVTRDSLGQKVFPNVFVLEAMAQSGCIYFYYSRNALGKRLIYYLAKTDAEFIASVGPGDQLRIEVLPIRLTDQIGFIKTTASVNDLVVAKAEIIFSVKYL